MPIIFLNKREAEWLLDLVEQTFNGLDEDDDNYARDAELSHAIQRELSEELS